MRIPTFDNLRTAAIDSLMRFPLVLLAGAVAASAGMGLVKSDADFVWVRLFLAAQLGIAAMFAITVAAETHGWPRPSRYVVAAGAAGALTVYGFVVSEKFGAVEVTRHLQLTGGLHLLVAFIPFTSTGRMNGFWQYNRALFLRFCLSVLYSAVLYGGLSVALAAIDKLLGIEVDEIVYGRLFFVIAMVFNTWVFVGGVPKDILGLETATDYTKGLRVFAQYILVPLVIVYLVILTIYLGKIIVTREWPSGWIGYLVSSVAAAGILAHLLVYPMRENAESQWVRTYSRWYYAAMVPAIVMLLLAVGKRIAQYGVTENRYLLAILTGWLALISIYFIATRARNIKLIPITLCVVAFGTSFGPWGAFAVSERSQMSRLTQLLEANDILSDGMIQSAPADVTLEDRKEISAVLDYLVRTHGTESLEPWFGDRWAVIDTTSGTGNDDRNPPRHRGGDLVPRMMNEMGIAYVPGWDEPLSAGESFRVSVKPNRVVYPLENSDVFVRLDVPVQKETIQAGACTLNWNEDRQSFLIEAGGDTLVVDLGQWVGSLLPDLSGPRRSGTMTWEEAHLAAQNGRLRADIHIETVGGRIHVDGAEIDALRAICFLQWRD